ncbi:MAG: tRNA (adenosine(37)-N6)-threonylcarbamoyltransferase complex transferase subunit TsaD [Chloroflexi bacterium RBG_19FT_COMBO_55_16]|nr:MAG: tRNA (adenosine(37)-N6)-threonylcarbamoyltransferase complex transferase subunit TsaD [Chloroflexi bacterium RBG_19FT_COMBO_55_16]
MSQSPQLPSSPAPPVRVLGIETSCDETAAAVVEQGRMILSSIVASQVDLHAQYGGIFPEVASRQHILTIYPILEQALQQAHLSLDELDAIAITRGPGLPGSLVVGMNTAKGLALGTGLPLIGVNHLEAHIYSAWLYPADQNPPPEPRFPLVALIVSGGHTELVLMNAHLDYRRLGGTLDDAAGEAFDKVARLLGLSYPGGPSIQNAALNGNPRAFSFPRAWLEGTWNFSFSGIKTAVLREVRRLEESQLPLPVKDLAASFQAAVVDVLVGKTLAAAKEFQAKEILVAGGVSANQPLRNTFLAQREFPVHIPPLSLCTDNAAMIAGVGFYRFLEGQRDPLDIDILPNWPISEL